MTEQPDIDLLCPYPLREHYTVADGLAGMRVEDIHQDQRGFLWVATADAGLSRFDGVNFATLGVEDGLPHPTAMAIAESPRGELWVGTLGGGIAIYDGERFRTLSTADGLPSDEVVNVKADADGSTLVFTRDGAVRCAEGRVVEPVGVPSVPEVYYIRDGATDGAGTLWLVTNCGVFSADGRRMALHHPQTDAPIEKAWMLTADAEGHIWTAPRYIGSEIFTHHYDPRSGQVETALLADYAGAHAIENGVRHVRVDARGRVWVVHREVVVWDGEWHRVFPREDELNLFEPRLTYEDREGNVWIGFWGCGLVCCDLLSTTRLTQAEGLPKGRITDLAADGGHRVWIATVAGLAHLADDAIHLERLGPEPDQPAVSSLTVDADDRVWAGTEDGEIYRGQVGRFEVQTSGKLMRGIRSLWQDRGDNAMWVCLDGETWGRLEDGRLASVPYEAVPDKLGVFACDSRGTFWLGAIGSGNGLYCSRGDTMYVPPGLEEAFIGYVHALCEAPAGTMWIGTGTGLYAYDLDRQQARHFTVRDGLPQNAVRALAVDGRGHLWIGTGGGAMRYDGEVFHLVHSGVAALDAVESILPLADGRVWFGTRAGLVAYRPGDTRPHITIRQILAGQVHDQPRRAVFPETVPEVRIAFQGISFRSGAQQMVYRHRLLGSADEGWSPCGPATEAVYAGLPPGEYRFEVYAVNRDGLSSDPVSATLEVTPDTRQDRIEALEDALARPHGFDQFIGQSPALNKALDQIYSVAETDVTVLILGETGTGKGVAARAIHEISPRRDGPFIQVNCGALPEGLVESTLFGHEKGAFTGATSRQLGRFELAEGGTLFLDEIGDLPLEAQTALLHVLQDHTVQRVGGTQVMRADVRVIAATNRDLHAAMREGRFREDLYYRLSVFALDLPPLRQRRDDISLLMRYFTERFALHLNRSVPEIDPAALEWARQYAWPGNVRELEHLIQRAVLVCRDDRIAADDIAIGQGARESAAPAGIVSLAEYDEQAAARERLYLERVLEKTKWVIYGERGAAKMLGVHPEKLRARMKRCGLRRSDA